MIASAGSHCLVDEVISLRPLLGDGVDGRARGCAALAATLVLPSMAVATVTRASDKTAAGQGRLHLREWESLAGPVIDGADAPLLGSATRSAAYERAVGRNA
jgi:hypothetical protein